MKKLCLCCAILIPLLVSAPVSALSDNQKGTISQHCGTIRQMLRAIQRDDSRNRIAIGAIYETISSKYIVPLNLRLVSNNISQPELLNSQTSFASTRDEFSSAFITYSQSFEALLSIDCQAQPEAFYEKLVETRALRTKVRGLVDDLANQSSTYQTYLNHVQEAL